MKHGVIAVLWRAFLVFVLAVLAWRVVTVGLARHYIGKLDPDETATIERVFAWAPEQPDALFEYAQERFEAERIAALPLLQQAYAANPADPRALVLMALALAVDGRTEQGDQLIALADRLAPASPWVQRRIASYWGLRAQPEEALVHLSNLLTAAPGAYLEVFPGLVALAERNDQRHLLKPFAAAPPSWWPAYFQYAAENAVSDEAVRFLFNLRRDSSHEPLTAKERAAFRTRLMRDGLISEAYLVWLNGLDEEQRSALSLLYNGGFELPLTNAGFDWHARSTRQAEITTRPTKEAGGKQALRIRFRGFDGRFAQLSQPLFLGSGTYRLTGRARSDNLRTQGGLRWAMSCRLAEEGLLGEGPRFLGSSDWVDFGFDFEVPRGCVLQELRLVSAGKRSFERDIDGVVWFDDLQVRRTESLAAAAKADAMIRQLDQSPGADAQIGADGE